MIEIEFVQDIPLLRHQLFALRKQIPFALSLALNTIAEQAQAEETVGIFDRFHVRREARLRTAIQRKNSTKSRPEATLTVRDAFLVQHEEGGIRRPGDVYSSIVQPESVDAKRIGVLRGRNTPQFYLERIKTKPRPFLQRMKSGKVGVFVRATAGKGSRYPIELIFAFERQAKIAKLLKFGATVDEVIARDWDKAFGAALGKAIATAR